MLKELEGRTRWKGWHMSEAASGGRKLLIDGAIRDADELSELGLPVWARFVHARGAAKEEAGEFDAPVSVGGVRVKSGDVVVMDGDGAVVVPARRAEEVLEAGRRREADEAAMMDELRAGALTLDLMGLRAKLGTKAARAATEAEQVRCGTSSAARQLQRNVRTRPHQDRSRSGNRGWRLCAAAARPAARS
jgi:hypothetical protein